MDKEEKDINPENIPEAITCILGDLTEIRSQIDFIANKLGLGVTSLKPITIEEAANFLSMTERAINKLVKNKEIPHYIRGNKVYFFEKELYEWINKGRIAPWNEKLSNYNRRSF